MLEVRKCDTDYNKSGFTTADPDADVTKKKHSVWNVVKSYHHQCHIIKVLMNDVFPKFQKSEMGLKVQKVENLSLRMFLKQCNGA